MADNSSEGRHTGTISGSSITAPSSAKKPPAADFPAPSQSAQQSEPGYTKDQRSRESGRERGKGRGRGSGSEYGRRHKKDMGRVQWSRNPVDKRKRNDDEQSSKRQKIEKEGEDAVLVSFSREEIAAEERKPKRKVAVMIGYAGSGYKGMQINGGAKTIEGDLFSAFVAAGAISKANADDPKKSSLVRCARTDKGVHAAGNVISLKLIVEDPEILKKINGALPPQIRVWGFERTNGSFSCYQTCDSRWYEYLIPTYSFLSPHQQSFLGKKLVESAQKEGVYESHQSRQLDVTNYWEQAEKEYVNPVLDQIDPNIRDAVMEAINNSEAESKLSDGVKKPAAEKSVNSKADSHVAASAAESPLINGDLETTDSKIMSATEPSEEALAGPVTSENTIEPTETIPPLSKPTLTPVDAAIRDVKLAYIEAKKAYRISAARRQRVQDALSAYLGTHNFHNYTIQKSSKDPSAKRVIKSFKVGDEPIIINDTEWLSLRVHGQSFMMHQIRKMVAMIALVIRCGCPLERISESYGPDKISIPKAPGLGLLLERPVFDSYNGRAVEKFKREKIDFDKFGKEIEAFKQTQIYERIFREEEKDHQFHMFFNQIDHYHTNAFLWVTATGIPATKLALGKEGPRGRVATFVGTDSEDEVDGGNEEG